MARAPQSSNKNGPRVGHGFRMLWLSTATRRLTLFLCLASLLAGGFGTQFFRQDLRAQEFQAGAMGAAEVFFIPPKPMLRVVSLGRDPFLADMLFIRGNQYFADHLFTDRIFEWLEEYIESILYLDPNNPRVYRWASQVVLYGQGIDNDDVERSNYYAKLGIEQFPNDWRFYQTVGFNLHFEWRYKDADERKRIRDEAREYFTIAASLPNSQLDPGFITELYSQQNDTRMALFQAYLLYQDASDRERKYLRRRIDQLECKQMARALEAEEERWRARYPFLPLAMYRVFGGGGVSRLPESWSRATALQRDGNDPPAM